MEVVTFKFYFKSQSKERWPGNVMGIWFSCNDENIWRTFWM